MTETAVLALSDGTVFEGEPLGAVGQTTGEVVFNTSHSGYQEILSDPSYRAQIVVFTFPHIGNTGLNRDDMESHRFFCSGLAVRHFGGPASNWRSEGDLHDALAEKSIVGIQGIDTRTLTMHLREQGAQPGCILSGKGISPGQALKLARQQPDMSGQELASAVSADEPYDWHSGSWQPEPQAAGAPESAPAPRIAVYDFGCKRNILNLLKDCGCEIRVFPARTPAQQVLDWQPHGVFLSNGPGDPAPCDYAIAAIRLLAERQIPMLGICLGHQLLALALGARTQKMKFGHHGANHPVLELATGRVFVSSQNHGFAVSEQHLPDQLEVTHKSLFDHSVQGIRHRHLPFAGFQGHPEASPGPVELRVLIEAFVRRTGAQAPGAATGPAAKPTAGPA